MVVYLTQFFIWIPANYGIKSVVIIFVIGAVVGSLEILGNPTGLVRSIGTGVADFFRMPYRGLTRGPGAFVLGVSSGTSSMVKNITTGG